MSLADAEGGTLLRYDVEAHVGGKIAQLGSRLIDGVAKGMADKFFASFAEAAAKGVPAADALAHPAHAEAHVTHHFAADPHALAAPLEGEARSAAQPPTPQDGAAPARAPAAFAARAAAPQICPPKKTSWFRRIWEWFMSR